MNLIFAQALYGQINPDVNHSCNEETNNCNISTTTTRTISNETHQIMKEINTVNTHIEITTATTRLWVTSSWYLRWRWMAKNLSTLMATTPKKEARQNRLETAWVKPCVYYSQDRFVVTTWPEVRCKMVDLINQRHHQKQQDSGAMFLMFLARM